MKENEQTASLLLRQFKRYPNMRPQDAVKLLYQSEFAGGHAIQDEQASLKRLEQEYASLGKSPLRDQEAFEYIGGGLCRLNLRSLDALGIEAKTANRFFTRTASAVHGDTDLFEQKLDVLLQLCKEGGLPYEPEKVQAYISGLRENGYPPVSHSGEYKKAYSPAYRVVKSEYRDYIQVFAAIDMLLKKKDAVSVAIDGCCGAGKSALASLINGVYDCNVFHMDDFFLRSEQRTRERLEEAGGNVDYERFGEEVIKGVKSGREFSYRRYDCKRASLGEATTVMPEKLSVIEGSYSMRPSLIDFYDLTVFLHIDAAEQSERILKRNGQEMHQRFMQEWIPMENKYFDEMNIRGKADIIFGI